MTDVSIVCFAVDTQPDTHEVDQSEIRTQILLATASSTLRSRSSFARMLTEVRPPRHELIPRTLTCQKQTLHCWVYKQPLLCLPEGTRPVSRLQLLSWRVQPHPLTVSDGSLIQFLFLH